MTRKPASTRGNKKNAMLLRATGDEGEEEVVSWVGCLENKQGGQHAA